MKKLVVLLLLFLVGCSNSSGDVICEIQYEEKHKIDRSVMISYTDNLISTVQSVDKIYFDDVFDEETFKKLEKELDSKLVEAKHLTYELINQGEYVEVRSTIVDIENAHANELSFIGLEINDKEMPLGLKETIALNEAAGYVCTTEK